MAKVPRVPKTTKQTTISGEDLSYEVQDEDGRVRTLFMTHPLGPRRLRRYRQRHHPRFTKPMHKGREWYRLTNEIDALLKSDTPQGD
jgi:hypothetical protein